MHSVKQLLVIGDPVAHSLSPLIHSALIADHDLPYRYGYKTVPPAGLDDFLSWVRAGNCVGFNATMPLKELLLRRVDVLSDDAKTIGAINTVCNKNGELYGYNTDWQGFLRALSDAGFDPKGKRAVLFGAGGAARAATYALLSAGVASLTVCNRTLEKAEALCAFDPRRTTARSVFSCDGADLLVNCTVLGMDGTAAQFADFGFLDGLPPHALVSDLIYNPRETALLREAASRGLAVQNGLPLLVHQAVLALRLFTCHDKA